ncbi:AMP-binding protein [Photobacterium kasasachensis]|uniref:AMP-binding protein n=1 Tax=Photobacterium kasasachensis TaxID=2910240 RepID=UPI003D098DAB
MFVDTLRHYGDLPAIVTDTGLTLSYGELADKVDAFADSLGSHRQLLIVETLNELHPLIAYLGALRARHPVILVAAGSTEKDTNILDTFNPFAVYRQTPIGSWTLEKNPKYKKVQLHPDLCVLLSTSGTTGSAKLVRLSQENIEANARSIAQYLELDTRQTAITTLPFHYSFGMSVINSHLAVGATLLLTERSVSEPGFWAFFREEQATSLYGVPYTFELLERIRFRDTQFPSLQYIAQAGGRLSTNIITQYLGWGEQQRKRLIVMYGQTEASPRMAYVPPHELKQNRDCIGIAIPGGHFSLIDEQEKEIHDPEQSGELVYKGPNVMMGYATSPCDLTKGNELELLRTGDLACRNAAGLYRIVGRMNRFCKLYGLRISLDEVELFLQKSGFSTVVVGNDSALLIATLQKHSSSAIINVLTKRYQLGTNAFIVKEMDEYPLLPSGKVDNRSLTSLIEPATGNNNHYDNLYQAYSDILGNDDIREGDSFLSLGGDSLCYVAVSVAIERYLGHLPDNWEAMTVSELEDFREIDQSPLQTIPIAEQRQPRAWLTICFIIGLLLFGEIFLHIRTYIKTGRNVLSLLTDNSAIVVDDKLQTRTYRPNLVIKDTNTQQDRMVINSYGLRSPEIPPERLPDEIRYAVVGASTVAGIYAKSNEQTFSQLLASAIKDKYQHRPVNIINAGIEGSSLSETHLITENIVYKLSPSAIIIYPGFNDITMLCPKKGANNSNQLAQSPNVLQPLGYPTLPNWLMSKDMIQKNTIFLRTPKATSVSSLDPETINPTDYRNRIESLVKSIIAQGIKPVLVTVARSYINVAKEQQESLAATSLYYYHCLDLNGIIRAGEIYNDQIRSVARQYNTPFVDLAELMPGGSQYFVDGGHFTYKGEQYVAKTLNDKLASQLMER